MASRLGKIVDAGVGKITELIVADVFGLPIVGVAWLTATVTFWAFLKSYRIIPA